MIAKQRMYLTADRKKLVGEGDKRAASLYATPGTEIPESAAKLFGLVNGELGKGGKVASEDKGGGKEKQPSPNKEKQPDGDKGAGAGTKGATADDLTRVKFVGAASAKALAAAGFATVAQLAAIDPENPPAVEGLGAVNWAGIVASAKELAAASAKQEGGAR